MPTITRAPLTYNFAKDVIHIEWTGDQFTGTGPYVASAVNLALYFQVWQEQNGVEKFLTERVAPYSLTNKIAFADISPSVKVAHSAPHKDSLQPNFTHADIDHGASARVEVRYGDQFGSPAAPEPTLTVSDSYYAIAGATRYMQGPAQGVDNLLHSYWTDGGDAIFKEVRKEEPDLLYYFAATTRTVQLKVTLYYTNGTLDQQLVNWDVTANVVNYISCGWNQLNLSTIAPDTTLLSYYTIEVVGGPAKRGKRYYHLDDRAPDHDKYLAYTNGCGGIEIARLSGYPQLRSDVDKDTYTRPRTANTSFQDGQVGTIARAGRDINLLSTGYYSLEMITHLRQLLLADAWIIDTRRRQYYKVAITNNSAPIYNTLEQKHRLDLTIQGDDVHSFTTYRN